MFRIRRCLLILMVLGWVPLSHAGQITLAWGDSLGANSYRVYQGFESGHYSTVIEVGHATTVSLGGLMADTRYFWAVTAVNTVSESGYSNEVSAVVPLADVSPPTVVITAPLHGSTAARRSAVTVRATAEDDVGVVRVNMTIDGTALCTDTTAPYQCLWLVPSVKKRVYRLQAIAVDAAGNLGESPIVEVTSR